MKIMPLILAFTLAAPIMLTGCDRTLSEQTKTKTDDNGNAQVQKKTVTESPNGDVTKTTEKKTVQQ